MSIVVADCPECKTKRISMRMTGMSIPLHEGNRQNQRPFGYVFCVCNHCEKPSAYTIDTLGRTDWNGVGEYLKRALTAPPTNNLSASQYAISLFKSAGKAAVAPEHLPEDVLKAFQQGETNFEMPGHEEAAATMYRRALERALKAAHPELEGSLAKRIRSLVEAGTLPTALGDWATEIRIVGNDGAHDEEVSRDDLKAARMFCDSFLRYLITLPKEIELRRQQPS